MNRSLIGIRAIAAEFARRIYKPALITVAIIAFVAIALTVWLVTIDIWWLLLAIPIYLLIVAATVIFVATGLLIRFVSPVKTKTHKKDVSDFVDKLQRVSEITVTPKVVLLFRLVKELVSPQKEGYLTSVIKDTASLKNDFNALCDSLV